ncbi:hypothetical protein IEQ34_003983 [Dendrobium chrysotoxum]|uniref:Uncharacterized protein n=1 Tax=Dendrobium chrysotoxum TaxID=161865 RepID=A0AAV7HH48_DENCH|nr:hypothetical protein IEQ34_003983 [Dendrobium chrysotoxum]
MKLKIDGAEKNNEDSLHVESYRVIWMTLVAPTKKKKERPSESCMMVSSMDYSSEEDLYLLEEVKCYHLHGRIPDKDKGKEIVINEDIIPIDPKKKNIPSKRSQKVSKADDVASKITGNSLIIFRKKFHFLNDLIMKVLRAGLRFLSPPKLIDILMTCGVSFSQLSYRAMLALSPECLSQMGHLISDMQGHISFRSKWLNIHIWDPLRGWVLNLPDVDTLHYEVCYLSRYVDEEFLFKVRLFTHAGRSHAHMLRKSAKAPEVVIQPSKAPPKWPGNEGDPHASKKKRVEEILIVTSKVIEDENNRLQSLLSEKEAISQSEQSPSRVIEEFKKFVAFKMIIHDQIQEARDHIYDVAVKALELEYMEEVFIRGFLKGVRLV